VSIVVTETPLNPSGRGDDSITYNTSPGSHTIFAHYGRNLLTGMSILPHHNGIHPPESVMTSSIQNEVHTGNRIQNEVHTGNRKCQVLRAGKTGNTVQLVLQDFHLLRPSWPLVRSFVKHFNCRRLV